MKRVLMLLVMGTVLSGAAAFYAGVGASNAKAAEARASKPSK